MPIVPLSPVAPAAVADVSATVATSAGGPAASSVAAFEQALFGPVTVSPERSLAGALQHLAVATRSPIGAAALTDSPERMLAAQNALHRTLLDVEVTARLAGALGQAINKLVSLQ